MNTKYSIICFLAIAFLNLVAAVAVAGSDIDQFRSCGQCGMDRKVYGYSRMLVTYENGSQSGVCSLHCAAAELKKHVDSEVTSIQVADRTSHALIDTKKAIWVMGGSKRGVMTKKPKWAFATKEAAEAFMASYGGKISSWEEVLQAAQDVR